MRPPDTSSLRPTPSMSGIRATGEIVASNAETYSNAAAQQLKNQLQAELAEWRALHRRFAPGQMWLEGRIAFSKEAQKADLESRKLELDRKAKEAERRIAQANAALAALADPRSDASTYHAILARLTGTVEPVASGDARRTRPTPC